MELYLRHAKGMNAHSFFFFPVSMLTNGLRNVKFLESC